MKNTMEGNITCIDCKDRFFGLEGKEDTCSKCLKKIMTCYKCKSTEKGLTENDNGKPCCDDCWE